MQIKVLESDNLKLEIIPEYGARIFSITQKWNGKQWLWHHPKPEACRIVPNANYDANWIGGWDDLFPNDAEASSQGLELPDHGEIWSVHWSVTAQDAASMTLEYSGKVFPYKVKKTISLKDTGKSKSASFRVSYSVENLTGNAYEILFKLHPAFAMTKGTKLHLPECEVEAVSTEFSSLIDPEKKHAWPKAVSRSGATVDLSRMADVEKPEQEFIYLKNLKQGWFGVSDTATNKIEMRYPLSVFPSFWIFADLGKWQGYKVAVMEPCTNYPKDLEKARKIGNCLKFGPRQRLDFDIDVTCNTGEI